MGKVRAKTLGDEEAELKEKQEAEARRLAKIEAAKAEGRARKEEEKTTQPVILGSEATPESEMSDAGQASMTSSKQDPEETKKESKTSKYAEKVSVREASRKAARSKNYAAKAKLIEKNKQYSVKEALKLVEEVHMAKFDETVELHINTLTTGINGHVTLPHGTGKQTKVAILAPNKDQKAAEDLLKEIEAGKINFDILVATPDAMPKLAKVARILGPRGLMPNPKNGTVTPNPDAVAKQYAGGQVNFKTEAKTPIIHMSVGKLSFGPEKLAENIQAALHAVKAANMKSVTLKSTMSPGLKLQLGK